MRYRKSIFKAYDIRGEVPQEINKEVVSSIVSKIGDALKKKRRGKKKIVVVFGHDVRESSPQLYRAAMRALKKDSAFKLIDGGRMTTPMLYFLVNNLGASLGFMVTASHNPKEFNGLKIVRKNAQPISGEEIKEIVTA